MAEQTPLLQIAGALDAIEVIGSSRYAWLGEPFDLPEPVRRLAPPHGLRAALVQAVQWRLYADFFTSGRPVTPRPGVPPTRRNGFARALSLANAGTGATETGWRYAGTDGERLMVERLGLRLWAAADEVVAAGSGPPRVGDLVGVRMAKDAPRFSPGFYMALSDAGLDPERPRLLDRYYFNVRSDAAARCVALVTRRLNAAGLPFRLKVLDDPLSFERCDTAVLTVQRRQRAQGLDHVLALHEQLHRGLEDGVPALTLPLAPGLAFAEDPGDGVSFGAQRCGIIASALVDAHERGLTSSGDRMQCVRANMARAGTTPDAPYLGPRSAGDPRVGSGAPREREDPTPCR